MLVRFASQRAMAGVARPWHRCSFCVPLVVIGGVRAAQSVARTAWKAATAAQVSSYGITTLPRANAVSALTQTLCVGINAPIISGPSSTINR